MWSKLATWQAIFLHIAGILCLQSIIFHIQSGNWSTWQFLPTLNVSSLFMHFVVIWQAVLAQSWCCRDFTHVFVYFQIYYEMKTIQSYSICIKYQHKAEQASEKKHRHLKEGLEIVRLSFDISTGFQKMHSPAARWVE